MKRLSLPAWLLVLSTVAFVLTWAVAPGEALFGPPPAPDVTPPPRAAVHAAPRALVAPRGALDRLHPEVTTIYGPGEAWRVAFTFDDGPHYLHTRRLLEVLGRHGVKATFFVNGYWLDERLAKGRRNRKMLRALADAGHVVGNHTFSHAYLPRLAPEEQTREIVDNHRLIKRLLGHAPDLFRPPYGRITPHSRRVLRQYGYAEALWSASGPDHEVHDPELIRDHVMHWLRAYRGGVVMLHDRYRWTPRATQLILEALQRENRRRLSSSRPVFRFVTLDSLLPPPPQSWALLRRDRRHRRSR